VRHLYVHVPFCTRRCSYCDFAIAVRPEVPAVDYLRGLSREIELAPREEVDQLETIYLGGGTPSRLGTEGIERLMDLVRDRYPIAEGAELTIEANPEDVTVDALRSWRDSGINRVSIGIQSFDDRVLQWMHRVHDARGALEAFAMARDAGFDNVSIDLIFALPAELERSWSTDLEIALGLRPDHVSLYGLTIERGTPLGKWTQRGQVQPADEDRYAAEFLEADSALTRAGYAHYEVSNFALRGRESRHNSAYWSGIPYAGIGPAAHSFDGKRRTWNVAPYAEWLARLDAGNSVVAESETLTAENRAAEKVYLGLRTSHGYEAGPQDLAVARQWADAGWAVLCSSTIRLTPEGWLRLDSLSAGLTGF
jgi:oxygen-independent coproporphyrinogen-3 oxidase